jgi:hypothetical protein
LFFFAFYFLGFKPSEFVYNTHLIIMSKYVKSVLTSWQYRTCHVLCGVRKNHKNISRFMLINHSHTNVVSKMIFDKNEKYLEETQRPPRDTRKVNREYI